MSEFSLSRHVLPGGLRVVLAPRSDRQTVAFLVLMAVGSRYEKPRQAGLSHFLEHMFFKGTKKRPSAKEIAEAVENVGGAFNAFTGEEYTGYYVKVASAHLDQGADVVADILLNPLFAKEEIEREKGVIQEEIRMYTEMPMRHIHHLWQRALFGEHALGRRIDGSQESVGRMQQSDFVRYVREHYHTENTVVVVAGQFLPERVLGAVTRLFTDLPKGSETFPAAAPKKLPRQSFVGETRTSLEQTHLMVGVPGVSLSDDRRWAVEILATVLGSGMSSRMFLNVRERHGLAYAIRTSADGYTDAGSLVTQAGVRTPEAGKALALIVEEYDQVMQEKVGRSELHKAKQMLFGHMMLELEETNSLALFVGGQELLTKEILTPQQIKERIDAVNADELQKVAQTLLAPSKRAVAVLGPHRSWVRFEHVLKK